MLLLPLPAVRLRAVCLSWLQMEQSFQMQINMGIAQDGESDEVGGWLTGDID